MLFTQLIHLVLAPSLSLCLGCAGAYISLLCSVQTRDRFCPASQSSIVPHLSLLVCLPHLFSSHFLFVFPLLCSLVVRLGVLYCLPYSTIPSICFRQAITLTLLSSCSFISFTLQPSPIHLSSHFSNVFLLIPLFPVLFIASVWSPLSSHLLSLPFTLLCLSSKAVKETYFVLGNPVGQAHLHDYAALLLIGSGEITLAERDVSD